MQSVTVVTRKSISRRIVGQKEEVEKDRDQRAEKDQIGQVGHTKLATQRIL